MSKPTAEQKALYRKKDIPQKFLSLDLEMNQPSGRIIQIGAIVGHMITGQIDEEKFSVLVQCGEKLCTTVNPAKNECNIPKLTGISQEAMDKQGVSLWEAYQALLTYHKNHGATHTVLTWGFSDIIELRQQLERDYPDRPFTRDQPFIFGRRSIDIKALHQAWAVMNHQSMKAGLAKAMSKHQLLFEGRVHNAVWDAFNTFRLAHVLFKEFSPPSP